jgi:hypothetical protein
MGNLSDALRDMGFVPTGEESPVDESGELWTKSKELVCDETGVIIDGNHHVHDTDDEGERETKCGEIVYRYQNSDRVKLPGGYTGSYSWGDDGDRFKY